MTGTTSCAHCGQPIAPPTGRASRKRYCGQLCRKAAWRARHRDRPANVTVSDDVPTIVFVPTASRDAVPTPGEQHRCPHCRQPLAVISVLVPAGAAVIPTPEVMHMSPT
jgi:hypothetical protein